MSKFKSRGQNMENRRGHNVKDKSGPKYGFSGQNMVYSGQTIETNNVNVLLNSKK